MLESEGNRFSGSSPVGRDVEKEEAPNGWNIGEELLRAEVAVNNLQGEFAWTELPRCSAEGDSESQMTIMNCGRVLGVL